MLKKIQRILTDKKTRFAFLTRLGLYNVLSDEEYLKRRFKLYLGYPLNLNNPKTFNEKMQWLKIHDRKPEYTMLVDKYAVKKYIAKKIGRQYIIPTLGVWDRFDDIDFESLPDQFVLKCTHDSGSVIICHDKSKFNQKSARRVINKCMKRNYYWVGREWPYKNVKPRIIAEEYMEDFTSELLDYKLMCFDGKVKCIFVVSGRYSTGLKVTFYDTEWNIMPFERHYPKEKNPIKKPEKYQEMVFLAESLAQNISFVRVDFYCIKGTIYFGEMTFFPGSGMEEFTPIEWDKTLGNWINI